MSYDVAKVSASLDRALPPRTRPSAPRWDSIGSPTLAAPEKPGRDREFIADYRARWAGVVIKTLNISLDSQTRSEKKRNCAR